MNQIESLRLRLDTTSNATALEELAEELLGLLERSIAETKDAEERIERAQATQDSGAGQQESTRIGCPNSSLRQSVCALRAGEHIEAKAHARGLLEWLNAGGSAPDMPSSGQGDLIDGLLASLIFGMFCRGVLADDVKPGRTWQASVDVSEFYNDVPQGVVKRFPVRSQHFLSIAEAELFALRLSKIIPER
jgi:hypothetical protein